MTDFSENMVAIWQRFGNVGVRQQRAAALRDFCLRHPRQYLAFREDSTDSLRLVTAGRTIAEVMKRVDALSAAEQAGVTIIYAQVDRSGEVEQPIEMLIGSSLS